MTGGIPCRTPLFDAVAEFVVDSHGRARTGQFLETVIEWNVEQGGIMAGSDPLNVAPDPIDFGIKQRHELPGIVRVGGQKRVDIIDLGRNFPRLRDAGLQEGPGRGHQQGG